ncbi:MAG: nucleotidyltransferase domain-containing protein [Candidatus Nitrosocosmicus sp.]
MNDDLVKLIDNVIDNCTPSKSEQLHLENVATSVKDLIKNFISNSEYSFVTDVVFGGSFAKGTWLKNETDIDIFVKFDSQIDLVDFENYG